MAFSFGSTTAPATAASTGFSLGGPPAKASATGFSFGAPTSQAAAPAAGGFGFGATTATTTTSAAPPAFGGFGTPAATATPSLGGFGGATTSTPAVGGFGVSATAPAASTGGFGAPGTSATTTSGASSFGGFGLSAATTSTASGAFGGFGATTSTAIPSFGLPTASATAGSLGGALASTPASSSQSSVTGLGGSTTIPAFGLGGTKSVIGGTQEGIKDSKGDGPSGKESMIPQELFITVEDLKKVIKEEKSISSEVSHASDKQLKKIKEDTEALSQLVSGLATGVQNNRAKLEHLKLKSGQELVNVEIAVRTRETPPSMQYENVAPMEYFRRLVSQFEQSMVEYRQGILAAEQHLQSISSGGPITSGDIVGAVQKLHQALTDLAAKYQVVHTTLTQQKCEYLSLQRQLSSSASNSSILSRSKLTNNLPASLSGPSPFNPPADPLTQAKQAHLYRSQAPGQSQCSQGPPTQGLGQQQTGVWGSQSTAGLGMVNSTFGSSTQTFGATNFGSNNTFGANTTGFGSNTSTFGASGFGSPNTGITSGSKRGKH